MFLHVSTQYRNKAIKVSVAEPPFFLSLFWLHLWLHLRLHLHFQPYIATLKCNNIRNMSRWWFLFTLAASNHTVKFIKQIISAPDPQNNFGYTGTGYVTLIKNNKK